MEVVTVRRFVNWQSREGGGGKGGQKGDMQGPLGQLDSHENEITTALAVLQHLVENCVARPNKKLFDNIIVGRVRLPIFRFLSKHKKKNAEDCHH